MQHVSQYSDDTQTWTQYDQLLYRTVTLLNVSIHYAIYINNTQFIATSLSWSKQYFSIRILAYSIAQFNGNSINTSLSVQTVDWTLNQPGRSLSL